MPFHHDLLAPQGSVASSSSSTIATTTTAITTATTTTTTSSVEMMQVKYDFKCLVDRWKMEKK